MKMCLIRWQVQWLEAETDLPSSSAVARRQQVQDVHIVSNDDD